MGELKEDLKGAGNQAAGNTKQVVGEALGDTELQQDGKRQENKGEAQHVEADVEGALDNDI